MAVGAPLGLVRAARVDAEHAEQDLDVLGPPLADDGEADARVLAAVVAAHGDVAVGLEDAAQVRGDLLVRRGPQLVGTRHLGAAREQVPALDERRRAPRRRAGCAAPATSSVSASRTLRWTSGQRDVEVLLDPRALVVVGDLELDRQRAVRAVVVLADEAVGLQPAGERRLGDLDGVDRRHASSPNGADAGGDERALGDLRAVRVQVHPHADLELVDAQPLRLRCGARARP